jgi:hypothetical protein
MLKSNTGATIQLVSRASKIAAIDWNPMCGPMPPVWSTAPNAPVSTEDDDREAAGQSVS